MTPVIKLWLLLAGMLLAYIFITKCAMAQESYDDSERFISQWFRDLKNPITHQFCCNKSDCEVLKEGNYKMVNDGEGYAVKINGNWMTVDPRLIIHHMSNPMDGPVLCHTGSYIFCYVPSSQY